MTKPKLTLALGGGGARGISHLGVIDALLEAGFEIGRIVGVSIGSLAGAMYAFDPDIHTVQRRALKYLLSDDFQRHQQAMFGVGPSKNGQPTGGVFGWYDRVKGYLRGNRLFNRVVRQPSLLPGIVLRDVIDHLLPDADLGAATVPLSVVAVDLLSGHKAVLERGPLRDAVQGSSALPGIFPPVPFRGMLLCDVGVFYSLPTTIARSYTSGCLVAVDVSTGMKRITHCDTALDVLIRMDEIGESLFRKQVREVADLVICPEVSGIEWFDFSRPADLLEAGRRAARRVVPLLQREFESSANA